MLWLSLLISCLVGFSISTAISTRFTYLEKIGSSFLLGIGAQVLWMMLISFLGIKLNLSTVYIGSFLCIGGAWAYILIFAKKNIQEAILPYNPFLDKPWTKLNLPWLAVMSFVGYIFWAITTKCLFWPTFEFDSVSGYDLMGKLTAAEGTFNNSAFMSNGQGHFNLSLRAIYPPLVSGSFAYAYMSGAAMSKIITSMFYGSFLVLLYGLLRRELNHLNVAVVILMVMLMPEMTSHAALSQTNLPQAVYTSTGFIALYLWYRNPEEKGYFLYLSMILLAFNSIIRTENVVFGFIAGLLVLIYTLQNRSKANIIRLFTYGFALLFPVLLWMLYLKINGLKADAPGEVSFSLAYNAEKFGKWWGLLFGSKELKFEAIVTNQNFFGLTPYLYFYLFIISSLILGIQFYLAKSSETWKTIFRKNLSHFGLLLFLSLVPMVLYSVFYYLIDYSWDDIRNVMLFSYKRGLFAVMTLMCFFVGANPFTKYVFDRFQEFLYGKA